MLLKGTFPAPNEGREKRTGVGTLEKKQLAAIVSSRNWEDLNQVLSNIDSVEMLSPLQNLEDLRRERTRKLLDVVFIDVDELDASPGAGGGLPDTNGLYVVFISDRCDPAGMRAAMQAGAKDFLARPFRPGDLAEVFGRANEYRVHSDTEPPETPVSSDPGRKDTRVITFFSTKGGAGKSALASNFALSITSRYPEKSVCLLDLDLQFGDLALILNVRPRATISDLVSGKGRISEELPAYLSKHSERLHLLASPARPEEAELVRNEHVTEIIESLSGRYDFVIIDTAASFHDVSLAALDKSHEIFLIITPIILSVKNLKGMLDVMMRSLGYPDERIKVILNRSDSNSGINKADIEKLCKRNIDFCIPSDGNVVVPSINSGTPAVTAWPRSKFSLAINRMADAVVGAPVASRVRAPFWPGLFRRFGKKKAGRG